MSADYIINFIIYAFTVTVTTIGSCCASLVNLFWQALGFVFSSFATLPTLCLEYLQNASMKVLYHVASIVTSISWPYIAAISVCLVYLALENTFLYKYCRVQNFFPFRLCGQRGRSNSNYWNIDIGFESDLESVNNSGINSSNLNPNNHDTSDSEDDLNYNNSNNTDYTSVSNNTYYTSVSNNTYYTSVSNNTDYTSVSSNTDYTSVSSNTDDTSVSSNTDDTSVSSNTDDTSVSSNTDDTSVSNNSDSEYTIVTEDSDSDTSVNSQTWSLQSRYNRIQVQLPPLDTFCSRSSTPSRVARTVSSPEDFEIEMERERDKRRCVVCQNQTKSVLILPCRHLCMCVQCADQIVRSRAISQRICPLCRTKITEVMNIYM